MPSGIASIPRYQTGGPTRREFLKRILGGLGGLIASRFGFPGGDEPADDPVSIQGIDYDEYDYEGYSDVGDYDYNPYSKYDEWYQRYAQVEDHLRQAGINPEDVPDDIFNDFMDEKRLLPELDFIDMDVPSRTDVIAPIRTRHLPSGLEDLAQRDQMGMLHPRLTGGRELERPLGADFGEDMKLFDERLENRYKYNKKLDELLASGDARFSGEYLRGGNEAANRRLHRDLLSGRRTFPYADADPEDVALYQRLQRLSRTSEAREAGERQARRGGQMFFGPSHDRPGILDSPSVRPSPSTAGRWARRGIRGLVGALGTGLGTAIDLSASPTKLGQGTIGEDEYSSTWPYFPIPEESPLTDEEKMRYYEGLMSLGENLGVTPRLPMELGPQPDYPTIGPRRVSGGIIELRGAA